MFGRAPDGNGAGPRRLGGGGITGSVGGIIGELRQIEQNCQWRTRREWRWRRIGPRRDGNRAVDIRIDAEGVDVAGAVFANLGDAQAIATFTGRERDAVSRFEREFAGWQCEGGFFASGPIFEQPRVGDGAGGTGVEHQRKRGRGDTMGGA